MAGEWGPCIITTHFITLMMHYRDMKKAVKSDNDLDLRKVSLYFNVAVICL